MNQLATVNHSELSASQAAQQTAASMVHAAIAANVDIDKLNKLLDFQERCDKRAQQAAYAKAMADCEREMPSVAKDRQNSHTKSWYATLEAINQQIKPIYAKHGFSLSFCETPSDTPNSITVVATLRHRDGHSEQFHGVFPVDGGGMKGGANKTDIQAKGSTLTYARRYLTLMIFNIAIEGEDTDGNKRKPVERITADEVTQLKDIMDQCDHAGKPVNLTAFLNWCDAESIEAIPRFNFGNVRDSLKKKLADATKPAETTNAGA